MKLSFKSLYRGIFLFLRSVFNFSSNCIKAILIYFFIGIIEVQGQELRDFETWTSAEFRYKPTKRWRFGLEAQLRMRDNSSEIDGYFAELTGYYEIFKNFQLGAGSRFIRKNVNIGQVQGYENFMRIHADAIYTHNINRVKMNYRLRYQSRDELGVSDEFGNFGDQYFRFKLGTGYDFKNWKFDPQLSAEIFHHLEQNDYGFNKFRATIGTEYKFEKAGRLGLFYRFEKTINTKIALMRDILRIQYIYTFRGYQKG